jgi:hypothetical protein
MTESRPESTVVSSFTDVDGQINEFCTAFAGLRKDFDSRVSLSTALVLSRTAVSVEMLGATPFAVLCYLINSTQYVKKS